MKRIVLSASAMLILLIAMLFAWLIGTESGARWSYQQVQTYLPGSITVTGLSGSLIGPLSIEEIRFEDSQQVVIARELSLNWNMIDLLSATISVSDLKLSSLDIHLPAALESAGSGDIKTAIALPQISFPLGIELQQAEIKTVKLSRAEESYLFEDIVIAASLQQDEWSIDQFKISGADYSLEMEGNFLPLANYQHSISLRWRARLPSGADFEGQGHIGGSASSTKLTQSISGALQLQLAVEISEPLGNPQWQSVVTLDHIDSSRFDPNLPPLPGVIELRAKGDLESATIDGQLHSEFSETGPFRASFKLSSLDAAHKFDGINIDALSIDIFAGKLDVRGKLNWWPSLSWQTVVTATNLNPVSKLPEWPGKLSAKIVNQGEINNGEITASADIQQLQGELRGYPVTLRSQLQWINQGVTLSQLNFKSGDTSLQATGRISDELDLQWSINTTNLAELYPNARGKLRANGKLSGSYQNPTIEAEFDGRALAIPDYQIASVTGRLALDWLKPQQLDVTVDAQKLILKGQVLHSVRISAQADQIKAQIVADRASANFTLEGAINETQWLGKLVQADILTRDFSNWKLTTAADIELTPNSLASRNLCLVSASNSEICSNIEGGESHWNINAQAASVPVAMFARWLPPELQVDGVIDAQVDLQYLEPQNLLGTVKLEMPGGIARYQLTTNDSHQFDYRQAQLELHLLPGGIDAAMQLDLINLDHFEGSIKMPGASVFNFELDKQILDGSARVSAGQLGIIDALVPEINDLQGALDLDVTVSGTLLNPKLKGKLKFVDGGLYIPQIKLRLTRLHIDAYSDDYETLNFAGTTATRDGIVSIRGNSLMNAAAGWPARFNLTAESLDTTDLIEAWLPEDTQIEGLLNAEAQLEFKAPSHLAGVIDLSSPPGIIRYPLLEGEIETWEYRDSSLKVIIDADGVHGNAEVSVGDGNSMSANFNLPQARPLALNPDEQIFTGEAKILFSELAIVEALVPDIDRLNGTMAVNLSANGTLASPAFSATAEIVDASVRVPRIGLTINKINLRGSSNDNNRFSFVVDARSGAGSVTITGDSLLDAESGWPTTLEIKGENFEISRIPEATIRVSPDLQVKLKGRSIDVSGELLVPYAKLQPKDVTTAAQVSTDTVIIDSTAVTEARWQITSNVKLILGDRVNFFGFGFEGQLGGSLLIREEDGQLTRGIGEINVPQGRYRAYGQRLDIENGRLLFTGGPLTNPGLDIRAVRKTGNVTAGILVRGTLQQPKLELFSIPAMGQTDALSYLLLGRPMETTSGEDSNMVAQAALALGLAGGDKIARTIGDRFGLDEMRLEGNDSGDQASLVLGRYLSPRLYVGYGVGLIGSFNTLNMRYRISDQWQLKAESGENHGADFVYTIER